MRQSLRRGLAALLALVLILGTYPAGAMAASLDEADTSAVIQEEETAAQTEENTETAEETTSDNASTEDTTDAKPEQTETETPTEETDASTAEEATAATDDAETASAEEAETEEAAAAEETTEEETEVSAASDTRTAAYKRSYAEKGTTFRILVIGNSYIVYTTQYLYTVAYAAGYDVVLGNLKLGSTTLANHWSYAKNDSAVYTYRKNSSDSWKTIASSSATMAQAVEDEDWDLIVFQQQSIAAGQSSKFYNSSGDNYLTLLADYVTGLCGNAEVKIGFEMTWAHIEDCPDSECDRYNNDQMTMYNAICDATQAAVVNSGAVDLIVTAGTAIQNVRSSYIGDTLTRDNKHLSYGLGRWLAAMSLASACGMDLSGVTTINSTSSYGVYSSLHLEVLKQSIADAEETPYAVTAQSTETPTLATPKVTASTSDSKLTLTWSAVSGATGYKVYQMAADESDYTLAKTLSTGKSSYSYTGSTSYCYYVCALGDDYIASVDSNVALGQPSISSVSNASGSKLTIEWSSVGAATGYQVQTATDSSFTKNVQTATTTGVSKTTSSRTNGTKYYVRVRAYKTVSGTKYYSAWSSSKSIYCVSAPSISSLKNVKTKKMTVKWSKNSKATGYQIQYSTSSSFKSYKTVSGTRYYSAWSGKKSVKISK
ncbi:MAG: DUF4886 domain-containing protein [Clostridiales bacterium]|nr:DUF4886 domain-containing protein [Clostridiales bacterium]